MKKKTAITLISISIALLLLCGAGAFAAYRCLYHPNIADTDISIVIEEKDGKAEAIEKITTSGLLKCARSFEILAGFKLDSVTPGCYRFKENADNRYVINSLRMGWQSPTLITISGKIRSIAKLASLLDRQLAADSTEIDNAFRKFGKGKDELTVLANVIPNTYEVYWTISPEDLIKRFLTEKDRFWDERRKSQAREIGLSPDEVTILASIVGEESHLEKELPVIAGVYINRLKRGIPLQADPTVKFAAKDPGLKRILNRHLEIDSPYNTYRIIGLPPGPIVMPSPTEIDAVLNYSRHQYLYFCADPSFDGSHRFAKTLGEHNRNAAAYHRALNQLGR